MLIRIMKHKRNELKAGNNFTNADLKLLTVLWCRLMVGYTIPKLNTLYDSLFSNS